MQFVPSGDIGHDQEFSFEGEAELVATENRDRITIRAMEKDRFERWSLDCGGQTLSGVLTRGWWKGFIWAYTADPVTSYSNGETSRDGMDFPVPGTRVGFRSAVTGRSSGHISGRARAGLPRDDFGLVCETERWVPAGHWMLQVEANDGVRIEMDGETVIDAWDGPTSKSSPTPSRFQKNRCIGFQWNGLKEPDWRISASP